MRATVSGRLGNITKGDPGKSAYEIAVEHGFVGTEEEWLASLSAEAEPAVAAQLAAEAARDSVQEARDEAAAYANDARTSRNDAASSRDAAQGSKESAEGSARVATTAAGTATEDAAYIASQISGALESAQLAAASERNAAVSAGEALTSQRNAKISEEICAGYSVSFTSNMQAAQQAAGEAAASASAAAASATSAQATATQYAADLDASRTYTQQAGQYAAASRNAAVQANDSADRAEAAAQTALYPLANYYNKEQTDGRIDTKITANNADYYTRDGVDGLLGTVQLQLDNRYTKAETERLIANIRTMKVVQALPSTDISLSTIYLVPIAGGEGYNQWAYIDGAWVDLGTTTVDMSGYETLDDIAPFKAKVNGIETGAQVNTVTGVKGDAEGTYRTGNISITPANLGLGNVDNTHDADKSVSYATTAGSASQATSAGSATTAGTASLAKSLTTLKRSTAYTAGAVAYTAALPDYLYLECVTAGTTAATDITV